MTYSQEAMITSPLGSWPICCPRSLLSERRAPSSSSSPCRASKSVSEAPTRNDSGAAFAAPPGGSLTFSRTTYENRRSPLRSTGIAFQLSLWGAKRTLLHTREKQLQHGKRRSTSRSQSDRRMHLFELGWTGLTSSRIDTLGASKRDCNSSVIIGRSSLNVGGENDYCDRSEDQPHGACSFRRSSSPSSREGSSYVKVPDGSDPDQSGYTIRVSKELMGVFRYVEKVKRARIKELANTLRQTAAACMFFSCVRGVVGPLVEVFQTRPPSWGRLILMLSAFDSFAITYLALKASEPLEKLSMLASESEKDIMGSIEKEEEHMLALAVELVKLFRRLRNITVCTALAQFASLAHSLLRLNNPKLLADAAKVIGVWLNNPWS